MKQYGDIELINGRILNCKVEAVDYPPTFYPEDAGRMVYNSETKQLYYNDGDNYRVLRVASETNEPLIASLGSSWLNDDYSFNPTPFNDLEFINGLTATDSLLTVITQIDEALQAISDVDLNDINLFNIEDLSPGDIIFFNGQNWVNVSLTDIPDFAINVSLGALADVDLQTTPTDNESIFFDSSINMFVNRKWGFRYENLAAESTHTVTHSLGQKYCSVTVINPISDQAITPTSVVYSNDSQLTVNLSSPLPAIILVTTIPFQR